MSKLTYFIFCVFLMFGPKIGMFDLSVAVSAFLLTFMLGSDIGLTKNFAWASLLLVALLSYQVIVQILNQNIQFEPLGRLLRALLTTVIIGLVVSGGRGDVSGKLIRGVLYALLAHSVLVNAAALYFPLNLLCSAISGNTRIQELRASGLFAGFDIAGYAALIGMAIILFKVAGIKRQLFEFVMLLIFMATCFFTSRVSLALGGIMLVVYVLKFIRNSNLSIYYRAAALLVFSVVGVIVAYKGFELMDVTFSLGVLDIDQEVRDDIVSRHAAQDPDSFLWADMFFLPNSFAQTIFGVGSDAVESDVGYVNEIFRYGVVGLIATVVFHLRFATRDLQMKKIRHFRRPVEKLSLFILVTIVSLTFKYNYLLVRVIYPVFLIVAGVAGLHLKSVGGKVPKQ